MTVRAKFYVSNLRQTSRDIVEVTMTPVYSPDPGHENHKFWNATPCGECTMSIENKPAADFFELGQEYFLDFSKAPKSEDPAEYYERIKAEEDAASGD